MDDDDDDDGVVGGGMAPPRGRNDDPPPPRGIIRGSMEFTNDDDDDDDDDRGSQERWWREGGSGEEGGTTTRHGLPSGDGDAPAPATTTTKVAAAATAPIRRIVERLVGILKNDDWAGLGDGEVVANQLCDEWWNGNGEGCRSVEESGGWRGCGGGVWSWYWGLATYYCTTEDYYSYNMYY